MDDESGALTNFEYMVGITAVVVALAVLAAAVVVSLVVIAWRSGRHG